MEPTLKRKRLWIAVPWSIAVIAVAGAGILLWMQYHPPGGRSEEISKQTAVTLQQDEETPKQDEGGSPANAALGQCMAELQASPDDQALREKIVKLAARASPAAEIPAAARDHYARARKLFAAAETINDVGKAIDQYQAALRIAPWWPEANKDLGLALETAQRHEEALTALGLYLAAEPSGRDARAVEDEIKLHVRAGARKARQITLERTHGGAGSGPHRDDGAGAAKKISDLVPNPGGTPVATGNGELGEGLRRQSGGKSQAG